WRRVGSAARAAPLQRSAALDNTERAPRQNIAVTTQKRRGPMSDSSTAATLERTASANARTVDMKLEIVVIPVLDVDRATAFYASLGWRLDADFAAGDEFRVIQFTPPGSGCSVIFGKGVTAAAPGSAKGLYLIVTDIAAARAELLARGVQVGEVFHGVGGP